MDSLDSSNSSSSRNGSNSSSSGGASTPGGASVVATIPSNMTQEQAAQNMPPSAPIAVQQPPNNVANVQGIPADFARVHQPGSPPPFTMANTGGVVPAMTTMINQGGVNGMVHPGVAGVKVMTAQPTNLQPQYLTGAGDPLDPKHTAILNSVLSPIGGMSAMTVNYNDATEANKMFIGGLSWNTNDSMLYRHFSQFGDVVEHCVMRDAATNRSRGFGFVKFADADSVERVLAHQQHVIDEKIVDPKRAVPKYQSKLINKTKKVFLGGLHPDTTNEDVQMHFSRFGEVEEVMLMYDRTTLRLRGFGFVKFALEEAAENACREHYHEIKGKMVEAKKAQPKEAMSNTQLKKWSYGAVPMGTQDPTLPYYINSQRNPMFGNGSMANPFSTGLAQFPYSPVMNYAGSPTFQVGSPLAGHLAAERTGTPTGLFFGELMSSPFNGQLPTRPTTMSPSPLDTLTRENFLNSLPYIGTGSPRGPGITSPPLTTGLDPPHEFSAGILATSPQNTGFQFGSPFGFSAVPPAMVAAYQGGYSNQ